MNGLTRDGRPAPLPRPYVPSLEAKRLRAGTGGWPQAAEIDDDPLVFNATHSEPEGVMAEGPELHFVANEATLGLLDDEAEWELG